MRDSLRQTRRQPRLSMWLPATECVASLATAPVISRRNRDATPSAETTSPYHAEGGSVCKAAVFVQRQFRLPVNRSDFRVGGFRAEQRLGRADDDSELSLVRIDIRIDVCVRVHVVIQNRVILYFEIDAVFDFRFNIIFVFAHETSRLLSCGCVGPARAFSRHLGCARLSLEPIVEIGVASPPKCTESGDQIGGQEQRSPEFVLPHVNALVRSRHLQRSRVPPDHDMSQRDGVGAAGQRSQARQRPTKQRAVHFDDAVNPRGMSTVKKRECQHETEQCCRGGPDIPKKTVHRSIEPRKTTRNTKGNGALARSF